MKRRLKFALVVITALIIASVPSSTATTNLVESGMTQTFDSPIVFVDELSDNTILVLQSDGLIVYGTIQNGRITQIWDHDLEVNATFASIRLRGKVASSNI